VEERTHAPHGAIAPRSRVPLFDSRGYSWITRVVAVIVLAAAVMATRQLFRIVRTERGLPLWDEAAQGFAGLEAARALGHFHLLEFLAVLNRQVVWPFVHALLLVPGFGVFGPGLATPALVSAALFGLTAVLAFAAGSALHPARGSWIGLLAAALLLASPQYRIFGTLGMLEMPGAFLLALTIALHARCAGPDAKRSWLIAAGASTAALFLLKYNYGLLWLVALMAGEWLGLERERRRSMSGRIAVWLRAGGLFRPLPLFVTVSLLTLAAIVLTGGFEFSAFGQHVSVRSPGNPAYALLVILTVWVWISVARNPAAWRARWSVLPERHRVLIATIGVPLLIWFIIPWPNRVRALADFVANRISGPSPWSLAGLLYYPRVFASDYSCAPVLGWIVLALALVPPRRGAPGARLLYIAALIGLAGTIAHRYHHPRFLFTTALLVWLSAARAAVDLIDSLLARAPRLVRIPAAAGALAAALIVLHPPEESRVREGHRAWRTSEALLPVMDRVLDLAAAEHGHAVLLGYSYALSPGLLSWRASEVQPRLPLQRLPKRAPWLPADAPEAAIAARLERMLAPGALVMAALPTPRSPAYAPGYATEVWADSVTAERLAGDRRVVTEPGGLDGDFRLLAFRVRSAPQ